MVFIDYLNKVGCGKIIKKHLVKIGRQGGALGQASQLIYCFKNQYKSQDKNSVIGIFLIPTIFKYVCWAQSALMSNKCTADCADLKSKMKPLSTGLYGMRNMRISKF